MSTELVRRADECIVCPRGSGAGSPIIIDLKAILKAESRVIEVQAVTPTKAGELLATFNVSWRDLHQHIVFLEKEKNDAERSLNRIRSTIVLDKVPEILKARNLTNNEHHREAVVTLDPEYQEAEERMDIIEAISELLKGKLKSFEMAYTSVKKLLGESAFNYLNRNDHRTSGDTGTRDIGEVSPDEKPAQGRSFSGFGSPKY